MTDAFAAVVTGPGEGLHAWVVVPQIIENDGTPHPPITVQAGGGITPAPGDYVLVLTARNNLDNLPVKRFYESSESNGRIAAVLVAATGYTFQGTYRFIGPVSLTGNLAVTGNTTLLGNLTMTGNEAVTGNVNITGNSTISGNLTVAGILTVGGVVVNSHTHANNAPLPGPTGPMV